MTLSVICPIYNEENFIRQFLDSILQQDYPKEEVEILLVDGGSKDRTRDIIVEYTDKYPCLQFVDNSQQTVPYAMNIGIKNAKGDIIIRLDAHSVFPLNYFSILVKNLKELDGAENVGGQCIAMPCNNSAVAIAIAECLSNVFGIGNSYFRIGVKKVMCVDTVPFGCFRKKLFDKIGLYDTDMLCNEDDELNGRINKFGGKIYLLPEVKIKYYVRDKISKVRKMFYQYGLYKPLVNKKLGSPATVRQFFPLFFVIGLTVGLLLCIMFPVLWTLYIGTVMLHLLIGICEGIKSAKHTGCKGCIFIMPYIFMNMHICYGTGYLKGICNLLFHRGFEAKVNR